jgi:hypothetical protein
MSRDTCAYLRHLLIHDPNTIQQSYGVSPKIFPRVRARQSLEPYHRRSHLPLPIRHLYPVRSNSEEPHLGCISRPRVLGN